MSRIWVNESDSYSYPRHFFKNGHLKSEILHFGCAVGEGGQVGQLILQRLYFGGVLLYPTLPN